MLKLERVAVKSVMTKLQDEDRVTLRVHQPQRHSVFVSPPGHQSHSMRAMALESADDIVDCPHYGVRRTFLHASMDFEPIRRSSSAPPRRMKPGSPWMDTPSSNTSVFQDSHNQLHVVSGGTELGERQRLAFANVANLDPQKLDGEQHEDQVKHENEQATLLQAAMRIPENQSCSSDVTGRRLCGRKDLQRRSPCKTCSLEQESSPLTG